LPEGHFTDIQSVDKAYQLPLGARTDKQNRLTPQAEGDFAYRTGFLLGAKR